MAPKTNYVHVEVGLFSQSDSTNIQSVFWKWVDGEKFASNVRDSSLGEVRYVESLLANCGLPQVRAIQELNANRFLVWSRL